MTMTKEHLEETLLTGLSFHSFQQKATNILAKNMVIISMDTFTPPEKLEVESHVSKSKIVTHYLNSLGYNGKDWINSTIL